MRWIPLLVVLTGFIDILIVGVHTQWLAFAEDAVGGEHAKHKADPKAHNEVEEY